MRCPLPLYFDLKFVVSLIIWSLTENLWSADFPRRGLTVVRLVHSMFGINSLCLPMVSLDPLLVGGDQNLDLAAID